MGQSELVMDPLTVNNVTEFNYQQSFCHIIFLSYVSEFVTQDLFEKVFKDCMET